MAMSNRTTMQESQISSQEEKSRTQLIAEENARIYLEADERAEERNLEMLRQLVKKMKQS